MTDEEPSFRDPSAEELKLPRHRISDQGSGGHSPLSNSLGTSDGDGLLSTSPQDDSSPVYSGKGSETATSLLAKQLSAASIASIPSPSSTAFYPHYQMSSSGPAAATYHSAQSTLLSTQTSSVVNSNWETYYTDGGKPYFYNTITGITQWEKPTELQQPMNLKSDAPVLPPCQPLGTDPGKSGPTGANLFM